MLASAQKQHAEANSSLFIHVQELNCGAPLGCLPLDAAIRRESEVLSPRLTPGIVQRHDEAGFGINRRDVGPLLQVAADATETQVRRIVRTKVLLPDDVVDLMGQDRCVLR